MQSKHWHDIETDTSLLVRALAISSAFLLCAMPCLAQSNKLCFPSGTWYGNPAPNLNSFKVNDPGWINSFQYVFGDGTSSQYAVVQGIRDASNNVFLSFEAEGLTSLDSTTVVVLAFDFRQSGQTPPLYELVLHPVFNPPANPPNSSGGAMGVDSGTRFLYVATPDSSGNIPLPPASGAWSQVSTPAWLLAPNNVVGYWQTPGAPVTYNWFMETEIPSGTLPIPTTGTFGLYVDIFRVVGTMYQESWWPQTLNLYEPGCPPGSLVGGTCQPGKNGQTPNPGIFGAAYSWGISTIDPNPTVASCKGVSVTPVSPPTYTPTIFTNNSPTSQICIHNITPPSCPGAPNNFEVKVDNSSVDGTGAAQLAPNVRATFSIANFGLQSTWDPSQWTVITGGGPPAVTNPTSPFTLGKGANAVTLPATGSWFPVPNQNNYDPAAGGHEHQCIMVTLDSTSGNVDFINNSAIQNMDFVDASTFERAAEINAKGYPARPDNPDGTHNPGQLFDLRIHSKTEVLKPEGAATVANEPGSKGGRVVSQLTWVLQGCRHTGRFMLADEGQGDRKRERKIELCDPVGAFGYVIRHRGEHRVKDWNLQFTGPNLTPVPGQPNTYQILIPQDGVATVTTHAEPQEQSIPGGGKVAVFLDAGAGIPHGTFSNAFKTGFSLNAGLEYMATSRFSAEGIFGYHHFPAKTVAGVAGSALNLYQFSANGKAYLTSGGPFRTFINAGVGGYDFTPGGGTHFGGNVGAGVLREFNSHWGVQASYNFHAVNTPGAATKFSTVQGGIRYVF